MFHIRRYQALSISILCSAVVFIINIGCRKDAAKTVHYVEQSTPDDTVVRSTVTPDVISIFPSPNDTGVDINASIVVKCNPVSNASRISLSQLVLKNGSETIDGKTESTDTTVTFTPNLNLERLTTYTVKVAGFANITPAEVEPAIKNFNQQWSFTTAADVPQYTMTRKTQHVTDVARDGAKMMQMGEYLYFYGGWTGTPISSTSMNDVYRSKGDLSLWQKLRDAPWPGRHTFGIGKINDNLYIYGGDQNNDAFDVWKSNDGMEFLSISHNLFTSVKRRFLYGTCAHQNKLYVLGGQSSITYLDSGLTDVWTTSNGLSWKKIADGLSFLGKNLSGSVASFNGRIWVVGGGYYGHPDPAIRWTNHVYSSADGVEWRRENDPPWGGRQYADLCVWDNKLWMVGGHNGRNIAEIWYMQKDGTWVQYTPSNLFVARHATAVAAYDDKLVIACGDLMNDCWVIERYK